MFHITVKGYMQAFYVPDNNVVECLSIVGNPPATIQFPQEAKDVWREDEKVIAPTLLVQLFQGITTEGVRFYFYARPNTSLDRFAMMVRLVRAQHLTKK